MTSPARWSPSPEALLAEHDWARRLARRLLREEALAEDVAQEACLRALERAPVAEARAWLAGVVRNLALQTRRERERRLRREALAARAEADSSAEALERLAVQQDVVRAVLALEEPYRSTIVLRFYENLPPRRIAARQAVPVATVKTRLARGLALLRRALDREHGGDGRAWALVLVPLAARSGGPVALLSGVLAMSTLLKTGLAAAVTVAVVLWIARRENVPHVAALEESRASAASELMAPAAETSAARTPPAERVALPARSGPLQPAALADEETLIRGRVVDLAGDPVPGVELALRRSTGARLEAEGGSTLWGEELLRRSPPPAVSDAHGGFALELPPDYAGAVVSQDERWETVLAPRAGEQDGATVLVAPRVRLSGSVRDPRGGALAGVELRLVLPKDLIQRVDADLSTTQPVGWSTNTDERGRFRFERFPGIPGAELLVRRAPYAEQRIRRDPWVDEELDVVLAEPDGAWLAGRVVAGRLAQPGATVVLGEAVAKCDERGEFRLSLAGFEVASELRAAAPGFLPALVRGDLNEDGTVRWPDFVRIELGGPTLAIEGRVLDAEGAPLAEQEVWLTDATVLHADEEGFPVLLESLLAGEGDMRLGTKTDAHGRFRLVGLEQRDYHLQVVDPRTALIVKAGPIAAGTTDVEIQTPADALFPHLRGVVRSRAGQLLAGLQVSIWRMAGEVGTSRFYYGFLAYGARGTTDEHGAFELLGVPRSGAVLHVTGDAVVDPELELGPSTDPEALEVVVGTWVSLQVHVGSAHPSAESFGVLDEHGKGLPIHVPLASGAVNLRETQALVDGRSPVVRIRDDARTLVLYHERNELARVPLELRADGLNSVDL